MSLKDLFRNLKPSPKMELVSRGPVELVDLSLRDGQQSLLATRMSTEQVMNLLPMILDTGVKLLEVWGGATLDSAMRYLNESPFDRLMKMSEAAAPYKAGLRALSRGQNLFGYDPYPDDIVRDFNREAVKAGVNVMRIFDALNYTPNFKAALDGVNEAGGTFDAAVCYTTGDPYDVDHFVKKALELEKMGAHMVSDKDMAGLKTPEDAWKYYTALKRNLSVPVVSHTHCTPGFGHISAVIALLSGVDKIDTAFLPLAGGSSHPSIELVSIFAEVLGIETGLDLSDRVLEPLHAAMRQVVEDVEKEFNLKVHRSIWPGRDRLLPMAADIVKDLARGRIDKALETTHSLEAACGFPPPNIEVLNAQIPGGMYSNFVNQLARDNKSEYLDKALEAVQSVRQKAGWCPLVTPTSQIVGVKAYFTALGKSVNPVQYFNLIAGYYGKTPFPIDPEYRQEVCGFSDEREYDSSGFNREIPNASGTELPLAETTHEKLLYYLFPDSSGKSYLEGLRQKEWEKVQQKRRAEEEEKRNARRAELEKNALINRFSDDMDSLSEGLSKAVGNGGAFARETGEN
ncbi:MAG TPA: carboxylase [Candidatus Sabulitectum sp.]|nr:carboxylase [Candidatus Sabulitectum sp.]HPR21407.1 carboxylase [Candidatus Sabulitectum sp.]